MSFPVRLSIFHKAEAEQYYVYNSLRGIRAAHAAGATAIDIDCQIDVHGVVVATHWGRPVGEGHFTDPLRQIGATKRVDQLSTHELARLEGGASRYRILPLKSLMREAAKLGLTICIEQKGDARFRDKATWDQVFADAKETGCSVIAMTLPTMGGSRSKAQAAMRAAKAAGVPTMLLLRGIPDASWYTDKTILDAVKGSRHDASTRPAWIKRLGTGPDNATKYGCSCGAGNAKKATAAIDAKLHPVLAHPTPTPHPTPGPVPPAPAPHAQQDRIIAIAKAQVGYHEGRSNGHWNNDQKFSRTLPNFAWSNFQAWCATFVSWCAWQADLSALYCRTASCDVAGAFFKQKGRWSEYPAVGAQIFYGTTRDLNHTGLVYKYDDTHVWTIEGNTNTSGSREGDGVYLKVHERRSAHIVGYGYPDFEGGIVSADPAWASGHKK